MVQLIGRICKDASVSQTKDGKKVVNFSIALNDSYKKKSGEVVKSTTYVNCVYWLNSKNAIYLTRGKLIEVNGRMSVNAYNNMNGEPIGKINFTVNLFKLYGKGTTADSNSEHEKTQSQPEPASVQADDLPF